MERLRQRGADLVCHCPKPQSGGKQADLVLTPLELIDRIAALVPPPRTHRHRYFGVLAPNSPLIQQAEPESAIFPARGPPLWDDCDAPVGEGVDVQPDWDMAAQAAPDYEVDQRTNW